MSPPLAEPNRLIVEFDGTISFPYVDGAESVLTGVALAFWNVLKSTMPWLTLTRLVRSITPTQLSLVIDTAALNDPGYSRPNVFRRFGIFLPTGVDPGIVALAIKPWPIVTRVWVAPVAAAPPAVNPTDDPLYAGGKQGYLASAEAGIGASHVWPLPGGDGSGIHVHDIEMGWTLDHEDLIDADVSLDWGLNYDAAYHGTAVLGIVLAVDNALGGVGIAPGAKGHAISQWYEDMFTGTKVSSVEDAIYFAASARVFGSPVDVLLIEAQYWDGSRNLPVETTLNEYDAIRTCNALGIVVVEPSGNGAYDLDNYRDESGDYIFKIGDPSCRADSGAIMVASGTSVPPHKYDGTSNCGSRVNCYGWGDSVGTCGKDSPYAATDDPKTTYTNNFRGSSAGAAIVAGAAAVTLGMAKTGLGRTLTPAEVRDYLYRFGTPAASAAEKIGTMPDLCAVARALEVAPDVYVRDFLGDVGDPHTSDAWSSPDIIVRAAGATNPGLAFGTGSGNENSDTLSEIVTSGKDHYVYVRISNRGGSDATDVNVTVYWTEPTTLAMPSVWNYLGSIQVPAAHVGALTVSDAIVWKAATVPVAGHYCFLAIIDTTCDAAPSKDTIVSLGDFVSFVVDNNNVAWRNFNVVDPWMSTAHGAPWVEAEFPFMAPGADHEDAEMRLVIDGILPPGARISLEGPREFVHRIRHREEVEELDGDDAAERRTRISLSRRRHELLATRFPRRYRYRCVLRVRIPYQDFDGWYQVAVSQFWRDVEVGRITWRLKAPRHERKRPS